MRTVGSQRRRASSLLVHVLWGLVLLPLSVRAGAIEWKELEGKVEKTPPGVTADGKAHGLMRENANNSSCSGNDTLDVTVVVKLHNGLQEPLTIDEEAVRFVVDGETHEIRESTHKIGEETITNSFRSIVIAPGKSGEVKLTNQAFLPTSDLEQANTIEVLIPTDKGRITVMYSGLTDVVSNTGGVPTF